MGNHPSVFVKSPQEHARDFQKALRGDEEGFPSHASAGFARVHFYFQLDHVKRNRSPDIVTDVPLDQSGSLDLNLLKDMWGLADCKAIDPYRYQLFEPVVPRVLSAWAVRNLAFKRVIYVTETGVESHHFSRRIRMMPIHFCDGFVEGLGEYATRLSLPSQIFGRTKKHCQRNQRYYQVAMLLLLFLFIALVACGIINLKLQHRFQSWARTGSIVL